MRPLPSRSPGMPPINETKINPDPESTYALSGASTPSVTVHPAETAWDPEGGVVARGADADGGGVDPCWVGAGALHADKATASTAISGNRVTCGPPIEKHRYTTASRGRLELSSLERKPSNPTILITGAAGNLGSLLARYLVPGGHTLRLMYHRKPILPAIAAAPNVRCVQADLADPQTLPPAFAGVDVVVHFAGVLFAPRPERFLRETNTRWFANVVSAALAARGGKVILTSFPQVEGPTTVTEPATGRLDREPISVHAKTRLDEERLLIERTGGTRTIPVILRLGMVYGRGILMIEAARWLARRRLLCVWPEPTLLQLISTPDFLHAVEAAIFQPGVQGIYHVGDEQPVTVQRFLDEACRVWRCPAPIRVPARLIDAAASCCEALATIARTRSLLTRDFVRLGRVPHWGDTRRMRAELLPNLMYPTLESGLSTLS
jgi:nucleoside-diphosphate-sugar epimerase